MCLSSSCKLGGNTSQFVHNQLFKTHNLSENEYFIIYGNNGQVLQLFKADNHYLSSAISCLV